MTRPQVEATSNVENNNLDEAFIEDDGMTETTRRRIMTNAEIAAELEDTSDDDE